MIDLTLLAVCVGLASAAQIFQKRGMQVTQASGALAWLTPLMRPMVMLGVACQGILTVLWLVVLSRIDVSLAFPVLSLGYVLVAAYSRVVLGERVSASRWAGVVMIVFGVSLLAYGTL